MRANAALEIAAKRRKSESRRVTPTDTHCISATPVCGFNVNSGSVTSLRAVPSIGNQWSAQFKVSVRSQSAVGFRAVLQYDFVIKLKLQSKGLQLFARLLYIIHVFIL